MPTNCAVPSHRVSWRWSRELANASVAVPFIFPSLSSFRSVSFIHCLPVHALRPLDQDEASAHETFLDSRLLVANSELATQQLQRLNTGAATFDMTTFLVKLSRAMSQGGSKPDFARFEVIARPITRRAPAVEFLSGRLFLLSCSLCSRKVVGACFCL